MHDSQTKVEYFIQEAYTPEERLNMLAFRHSRLVPTIAQYMEKHDIAEKEVAVEELARAWLDGKNTERRHQFYATWCVDSPGRSISTELEIIGSVDAEMMADPLPMDGHDNDAIKLELKNLRVHESARRKGVGRALVSAVQQCAEQVAQPSTVYLEVDSDNAGAISLYQQMGFAPVDPANSNRLIWSSVH